MPSQERAVGHAGRREQHVAGRQIVHIVDPVGIGDVHAAGAVALFMGVEDQLALHLPADAAQRRGRQHAFGRAARAEIDIDAGILGIDRMDHPGNVAVADQLDRDAGDAQLLDQCRMARPVEHDGGDLAERHALGGGQRFDVFGRRSSRYATVPGAYSAPMAILCI